MLKKGTKENSIKEVPFGEKEFSRSNQGNEISFECVVPEENDKELLEGLVAGVVISGLFEGVK